MFFACFQVSAVDRQFLIIVAETRVSPYRLISFIFRVISLPNNDHIIAKAEIK